MGKRRMPATAWPQAAPVQERGHLGLRPGSQHFALRKSGDIPACLLSGPLPASGGPYLQASHDDVAAAGTAIKGR